ncbi:MAG: hypothetical protein QME72_07295 [Rhodococcus sp. (in: high G+C Gram-positive bacteria)]|nr:hypothetical protein [Rhodococcus sp. (in: high G+C Gram-positive bacteria)]MDI6627508.1 hypothetical protein [Rhodococcus sp. (in: high G+C Gram-positive bacteria)]
MSDRGFGKYLGDDHRVASALRAKKVQIERDERKREHENSMAIKRSKREADRQAEADKSHGVSQVEAGRVESGGSPIESAQRRENAGRGFGRYLDN